MKVNKVTAAVRHGTPVSMKALEELCERQLEAEKTLAAVRWETE